jgi:hypothetical protein
MPKRETQVTAQAHIKIERSPDDTWPDYQPQYYSYQVRPQVIRVNFTYKGASQWKLSGGSVTGTRILASGGLGRVEHKDQFYGGPGPEWAEGIIHEAQMDLITRWRELLEGDMQAAHDAAIMRAQREAAGAS